jgi:hypothetical protein
MNSTPVVLAVLLVCGSTFAAFSIWVFSTLDRVAEKSEQDQAHEDRLDALWDDGVAA